jgi:phenylpropionate dioxygenase-like ring-hydroxylating dioxygenase large terminal subunit
MTAEHTARRAMRDALPLERDIRRTGIDPNFWYPVARSSVVKTGSAHTVAFAGAPIVLIRGAGNRVFALEDRCAHRQVPLHLGEVSANGIKCAYHGWSYDQTGRCVSVPYLDHCGMQPNNVRAYPCREAYGLVFVFPGDPARAESVVFPAVPTASDQRYKIRCLDRRVDCHYSFMHENLMDMNHQFLHRRLMGGIKTIFLGMRSGERWIEADYTFKRQTGKQPLGEALMLRRNAPPPAGHHDLMTIRTEYPYQTLKFWMGGSSEPALELWNVYIPVDRAQHSNHTYGLMMFRRPSIPGLMNLLWPGIIWFTNRIFAEDRLICELEQAAFDAQGADCNHEIFPALRGLRRVLVDNGVPLDLS